MAQHWKRRISRIENNGSETVLAAKFEGDSLNSPNDLVVKSDGSIFFTDPPFGLEGRPQYLTFAGIFRINPSGSLQLLDATLAYPNGIAFSPNEKKLYVNDSQVRIIYVWDVQDDTTIVNRQPFASINPWGYADGMKVDEEGNLFVAGPLGVWVFDSSGTVLDTIRIIEQTTNCNWGDADGKSLYITADNSLYRARDIITNIFKPNEGNLDAKSFKLYGNYPNPFNPRTIINYQLPVNSHVDLSIYNLLGQKVVTLISGKQAKGIYHVEWNADGYTSGVYLCRLEAVPHSGEPSRVFIQTRKVVLLK
jgi:gluconolactonase